VTWAVIVAFILLLYGTVMVFLAFDRVSHSNSDTIRPFVITMAPVWAVAVADVQCGPAIWLITSAIDRTAIKPVTTQPAT